MKPYYFCHIHHRSRDVIWSRALSGIAAASIFFCAGCQTPPHEKNKLEAQQRWSEVRGRFKHQLARQQYEGGLFKEAVMTATESISLDPTDADAYVILARANLELGKVASVASALDAAEEVGLKSPALTYTRGVVLEQRGDLSGALTLYHRARSENPREVDYLLAEAECLVANGQLTEALELLEHEGRSYDDRASVETLAAHVAERLGKIDKAIEHFRVAVAEQSASRTVPRELGLLYARLGRCGEAITQLRLLIDDNSSKEDRGLIRRTLASCYLRLGAYEPARDMIAPYAEMHEGDALSQLILAKASLGVNDTMTALRAVERAGQAEPNRTEVWLVRAAVQWHRGDFAAAADSLYDVLANDPDDVEAMCLLAEVLKATQRSDGARGYFDRALQVDPQSHWARLGASQLPAGADSVEKESLTAAQ